MSEFPGIETAHDHGLLDFGQELREEVRELVSNGSELPDEIAAGLPSDIPPIPVRERQAKNAHYRTYTLDGVTPTEITTPYPARASLTITCQSGGPARLGADNEIGSASPDARSVALPPGAARTLHHTDRIFAHGPAGTVVDVVEEHFAS